MSLKDKKSLATLFFGSGGELLVFFLYDGHI